MGKSYKVGIVGEASYQGAIRPSLEFEAVALVHEPDNAHDSRAVRVETQSGDTIGYLARDGWLTSAIVDERKPYEAWVSEVTGKKGQNRGVVIEVIIGKRAVAADRATARQKSGGCFGVILVATILIPLVIDI